MATPADIVALAAKLTKAEDSPAQDGHPGVPILGRRNDGRAALTSADGDYGNIAIDSSGRVAVNVDGGSITGTFTAGAEHAEDVAVASGDTGSFILGMRNDAAATTLTSANGDYSAVAVDNKGRVLVDAATAHSTSVTVASVAASVASVTLLAANTLRRGGSIVNDSTSFCWMRLGTPASSSNWTVPMVAGAYYEIPFGYDGQITGIWVTATGFARCSENT